MRRPKGSQRIVSFFRKKGTEFSANKECDSVTTSYVICRGHMEYGLCFISKWFLCFLFISKDDGIINIDYNTIIILSS